MGRDSKIEWTTHTFNPWIGCQKVSPGCDNCYAEALMDKRYGRVKWGPHGERKRTSAYTWHEPVRWAKRARKAELHYRPRVFCASLSDWLDNQVPDQWRRDLADLINATPELDWLLLTKRIENFGTYSPWRDDNVPTNVWLGVTAEDQQHYSRRWNILRTIPAAVRFISHEPVLGQIKQFHVGSDLDDLPDWIIMGGESGPGARPMEPQWARETRDYCQQNSIAFFMKQMTSKQPIPDDLLVREFPT